MTKLRISNFRYGFNGFNNNILMSYSLSCKNKNKYLKHSLLGFLLFKIEHDPTKLCAWSLNNKGGPVDNGNSSLESSTNSLSLTNDILNTNTNDNTIINNDNNLKNNSNNANKKSYPSYLKLQNPSNSKYIIETLWNMHKEKKALEISESFFKQYVKPIKNPYNYEVFGDYLGLQTSINPVLYIQPTILNRGLKNKNHIIAADFETVEIENKYLNFDNIDINSEQELEQLKDLERIKEREASIAELENIIKDNSKNSVVFAQFCKSLLSIKKNDKKNENDVKKGLTSNPKSKVEQQFIEIASKVSENFEEAIKLRSNLDSKIDKKINNFSNLESNKNDNKKSLVVVSYSICGLNEKIVRTLPLKLFKNPDFKLHILKHSLLLLELFFLDVLGIIKKHLESENKSFSQFFMTDPINMAIKNSKDFVPSDKYVVYFHNGGNFDYYFLMKCLLNSKRLQEAYLLNDNLHALNYSSRFYSLTFFNLTFLDSYLMIKRSLNDMSKLLLNKSKFEFDVKSIDYSKLENIFSDKTQYRLFRKYNLMDSVLLHDCMKLLQDNFWDAQKIDISNYRTTSSLGHDYFLAKYYRFNSQSYLIKKKKDKKNVYTLIKTNKKLNLYNMHLGIFIIPSYLESQIRSSFYGGRTELYKPKAVNTSKTINIDVNSLYPFAATAPLPTGPALHKKYNLNKDKFTLNFVKNFMGFFLIEFVSPNDTSLLPVLPRRHPDNHNVYALGEGKGWYFAKEVALAIKMGYKVKIKESISYKAYPILRNFVKELYSLRTSFPKGHPLNLLYKDILNSSSFGRFAIKPDTTKRSIRTFLNESELDDDSSLKKKYAYLVKNKSKKFTLKTDIKAHIAKTNPYQTHYKTNRFFRPQGSLKLLNSAVQIASAITSQARITMYHFLAPLYKENMLYYTDTDSLYYSTDASNIKSLNFLKNRINNVKLGFFKVEKESEKVLFLAPKLYMTVTDSVVEIKCKGLTIEQLTTVLEKKFKNNVVVAFEQILADEGSLIVSVKDVNRLKKEITKSVVSAQFLEEIRYTNESFTKYRTKILNNNNEWVDTSSLILNKNFKPITLTELSNIYNNFVSNIV